MSKTILKYYKLKREAQLHKKKGERIYYNSTKDKYYILKPPFNKDATHWRVY